MHNLLLYLLSPSSGSLKIYPEKECSVIDGSLLKIKMDNKDSFFNVELTPNMLIGLDPSYSG